MLYLSEFYEKNELDEQLDLYFENELFAEYEISGRDEPVIHPEEFEEIKKELRSRFYAVKEKTGVIDPMLASVSKGWRLERMGRVDLQIMRMAVYEIFYDPEVPSAVAIDEAVRLARDYGSTEEAFSFINGILGKLDKIRTENEG